MTICDSRHFPFLAVPTCNFLLIWVIICLLFLIPCKISSRVWKLSLRDVLCMLTPSNHWCFEVLHSISPMCNFFSFLSAFVFKTICNSSGNWYIPEKRWKNTDSALLNLEESKLFKWNWLGRVTRTDIILCQLKTTVILHATWFL